MCLHAGREAILDPGAFRRQLPRKQWEEWLEFFEISPPLGRRLDVVGGILGSTIANVHRDKERRGKPFTIGEFVYDWLGEGDDGDETMTPEQINDVIRQAKATAAALAQMRAPKKK